MAEDAVEVTLAVQGAPDSDAAELDELTSQLRSRLLELDVDDVERARGGAIPEGARAVDPVTLGALVVTLAPAVLQAVVSLVETWTKHRRVGGVTLTIDGSTLELKEASQAEQDRLVELFVAQHSQR